MTPSSEAYLRHVVRESVKETLSAMGFTTDTPHELQADMMYVRKARRGSEELSKWARRTIVTTALTAMIYALYNSLKLNIRG